MTKEEMLKFKNDKADEFKNRVTPIVNEYLFKPYTENTIGFIQEKVNNVSTFSEKDLYPLKQRIKFNTRVVIDDNTLNIHVDSVTVAHDNGINGTDICNIDMVSWLNNPDAGIFSQLDCE